MRFRLLGPVVAEGEPGPVSLGPARQRTVLAVLLTEPGSVIAPDRLVDRVWGEAAPQRARQVLHTYLSRLRGVLAEAGGPALNRHSHGYALTVEPAAVDLHRFRTLVGEARQAADDDRATALWHDALGLWRGTPYADLDSDWLRGVATGLEAERLTAILDRNDVLLRRGEHTQLLPELTATAAEHPLDERLAGQLILALYRNGRQADALAHYEQLRRRLADELGSDPAPASQRLYHQLLTSDAALAIPERPAAGGPHTGGPALSARPDRDEAPVTLPWDARDFTGRAPELEQLDACAAASHRPGTAAAVVISGGGGVGKTALAVHWAHHSPDRFPDGRLYVNLQGFSEREPLTSAEILRSLLRQIGVPGAGIPSDLDQAQRLYRRTFDGRRILVILDNALDGDQVRPLLTGSPGLTLVTSRNRLTGLTIQEGATEVLLGRLPDGDARTLIGRLLGGHPSPGETSRLSEMCANLPLAIRLATTGYRVAHPDTRLGSFLEQLAGDRIGLLDAGADSATTLTNVLSHSVQRLPPDLVHAFRLIGLHPGPRIDLPAIAALLGTTAQQSRRMVRALTSASLLEETSPDRWSMHDLLAEYARDSADSADSGAEAGYARLLEHYTGRLAAGQVDHQWLQDERAALLACLRLPVAGEIIERYALQLGDRLFDIDLYADSRYAYEVVRQRCPADSHAYAMATLGTGCAHLWLDEPAAEPLLRDALGRFRKIGDLRGEARTLRELAEWRRGKGIHQGEVYLRALELSRQAGDLDGESQTLMIMALEAKSRADYPLARDCATRALQTARQAGSRRLQGEAHRALGRVAHLTGDPAAATDHLTEAVDIFAEVGYQVGRAICLSYLGDVDSEAGRHQQAMEYQQRALPIFVKAQDRTSEALSCLRIGKVALAMNDPDQARVQLTRALHLNRQLENGAGVAVSLIGLADVLFATGAYADAAEGYRQAATDLADLEFPRAEAEARLGLGRALDAIGDHDRAREELELALALFEKINSPQAAEVRLAMRQLPAPMPPPRPAP